MATQKAIPKNISIKVQDISLKSMDNHFITNYLVNRETDPEWEGNWLIFYLYLFYLFKKYKHTNSIYIRYYDIYSMRIVLKYKIEGHSNTVIEKPDKKYLKFFMQEPLLSYIHFIIEQINNNCSIFVIPLIIDITTVTHNIDGTTNEKTISHKNVIIYKKVLNAFEHFEPYGDYFKGPGIDNHIQSCLQILINYINRQCGKNIKFLSNNATSLTRNRSIHYTSNNFPSAGPQTLEFWAPEYTTFEKDRGYCVAWSLLFIELSLKYPSMSIKQLNQKVMEGVIEAILRHEGNPQPRALNFSRRYLYLARNYCFYIISQIEFNYNFIFDDFIHETNSQNKLIKKVGQIYDNTEFTRYLVIINCLYAIEFYCINNRVDYKKYFQILHNNYKGIYGYYPQKQLLNKPIMEVNEPDFDTENEFWDIVMMNLLKKLIETEKKKTAFHMVKVPLQSKKNTTKKNKGVYSILANDSNN